MAKVTLKGNTINTFGDLPEKGTMAPDFIAVKTDLSETRLSDYRGKKVILNIFPSLETSTCAASVRQFNKEAQDLHNTVVLCISMDLPFAHGRCCGAEGLDRVIPASIFRSPEFGKVYGVQMVDGPLKGLMSRSVVIINEDGGIIYTQQVPEISEEPDYKNAIAAI